MAVRAQGSIGVAPEWEWLPHQAQFFRYDPRTRLETSALLGGWGSGKTTGAARKAFRIFTLNPWTPAYGNDNPTSIVCAPTYKILRHATFPALLRAIPRQCILRKRGPPHNDLLLSNGHRVLLYSAESEIEGITACSVFCDEIAHYAYASKPERWLNLVARIRDPESPRLAAIVSGLPQSGWVRDTFDVPPDHPNRHSRLTLLAGMNANHFIPEETRAAFLDSCPSGLEEAYLEGRWMPPQHAVYPQYRADEHLTAEPADPRRPVHVSLDVGNFGAILFGQEHDLMLKGVTGHPHRRATGLRIVDEILTVDDSVERQCYRIKTETNWRLQPGYSKIYVDPTIRRDELKSIRTHFPRVQIVKRERGDDLYPIEAGVRLVARALRDSLGNVRLTFARHLAGRKHGLLDGLERYRRHPISQEPIKDNSRDHSLDALRYMVCGLLPTSRPGIEVRPGRAA